ncbi:XRE family transcriptional regulator [archaeon]|nr:MAG: XRE family transcriptional regulator [archaeon]
MIAPTVVEEIRGLLCVGALSQRKIARRLGISRGTVNAIAVGRRPDHALPAPERDGFPAPSGVPVRCPGCGGRVQMPCLLCYVRAWKKDRQRPQDAVSLRPSGNAVRLRPALVSSAP